MPAVAKSHQKVTPELGMEKKKRGDTKVVLEEKRLA